MTRAEVLEKVLQADILPTLPAVAARLLAIASKEETTMTDIADLVSMDVALSAKILKVVNSAFYSFPQPIGSIHKAVSVLGTNAVRSLALSFSLLSIRSRDVGDTFDYGAFWNRSLAAGVSAKLIMSHLKKSDPEEIFIAGMLQNVGEMILARTFPEQYRIIREQAGEDEARLIELERATFEADHAFIGAKVLQHWGLPSSLVLPTAYHHNLAEVKGGKLELVRTAQVVCLSSLLSGMFYAERPDLLHKEFRREAARLLKFDHRTLARIEDQLQGEINQTAKYFNLNLVFEHPIEELLQEANQKLAQLNMSYEQVNRELLKTKMELFRANKELQEKNARLEALVNVDALTEVYNHRYFQSFLRDEVKRTRRTGKPLSMIMLDVDNFKKFNDDHGHQVGDFVLREVCRIAGGLLREDDLFARYGGEEFTCVLPETEGEKAAEMAEALRLGISTHAFEQGLERYGVTVSLGLATLSAAGEEAGSDELIGMADRALMAAKKSGKNRVEVYSPKSRWFKFKG
jgi:diguanylate cyclase (GGDEF)-like protein